MLKAVLATNKAALSAAADEDPDEVLGPGW